MSQSLPRKRLREDDPFLGKVTFSAEIVFLRYVSREKVRNTEKEMFLSRVFIDHVDSRKHGKTHHIP